MDSAASVATWLEQLRLGQKQAIQKLWQEYYAQLVRLARRKLAASKRRVADEEDVAVAAFHSFCRGIEKGRFPRIENRDDLWQVLLVLTARKASDQKQLERRQKRGGGRVRGESVFAQGDTPNAGLVDFAGREPSPEFAILVGEELDRMLKRLDDESLRELVVLKLEGYANAEIAERLGCGLRTVERKLSRVRAIWEKGDDE
jgi:DNA-directed RNA polymerase specialized sigma24 family protein